MTRHWPEYLIEACGLGLFMISASLFGALLENPVSPIRAAIADAGARRLLMGLAMGLTSVGIVYSPWGMRSGAHINPAVTLTFWRLGRVGTKDAFFYMAAQFAGGAAGMGLAAWALGGLVSDPAVNYVVTVPGALGARAAFAGEALIAFVLMITILVMSNTRSLARYTGLSAGLLVALYITFESPISGMSMNPARTVASALSAGVWTNLWIYLTAPTLAMLAAGELYLRVRGAREIHCAKLHHDNDQPCIFFCNYPMAA